MNGYALYVSGGTPGIVGPDDSSWSMMAPSTTNFGGKSNALIALTNPPGILHQTYNGTTTNYNRLLFDISGNLIFSDSSEGNISGLTSLNYTAYTTPQIYPYTPRLTIYSPPDDLEIYDIPANQLAGMILVNGVNSQIFNINVGTELSTTDGTWYTNIRNISSASGVDIVVTLGGSPVGTLFGRNVLEHVASPQILAYDAITDTWTLY
jgi:hypothetical protein